MPNFETPPITRGVRNLLIATVLVYAVQILPFFGSLLLEWCDLVPSLAIGKGQIWRFFTYMFLHDPSGPWHLAFNMLALWMFGSEIENMWGYRRFTAVYLFSGIAAGAFSFLIWDSPVIGASGAVLSLLTIYAMYFPNRQILIFFIFPAPVWIAVVIIGFISVAGSMTSAGGIAHLTHLGGILAGLFYIKAVPFLGGMFRLPQRRKFHILQKHNEAESSGRYDSDKIDPILRKISISGMGSLSREERQSLEKAAENMSPKKKGGKIIPFDFSRHS
jgi:membrane associated rhomboid family serine protease